MERLGRIMDLTIIDGILANNTPTGTNVYGGNVRSGDFTVPGANGSTPGVGVGLAISSQIFMSFEDFALMDTYTGNAITLASNSTKYFSIPSFTCPSSNAGIPFATQFVDINDKTYVRFRSACSLFINPSSSSSFTGISLIISYKDYYGNPGTMVFDTLTPVSGNTYFTLPRCIYELYSIKFTANGDANSTNTFYIGVYPTFELPYFDLGEQCNLLSFSYSFPYTADTIESDNTEILIFNGTSLNSLPNYTISGYGYTPGNKLNTPLTATTGTPRPMINMATMAQDISTTYTFLETLSLIEGSCATVIQNVYGIGNQLPNYFEASIPLSLPTDAGASTYLDYFQTIIGLPQYNTSWTDRNS